MAAQGKYRLSASEVLRIEALLADGGLTAEDSARLHFALAAVDDREGQHDRAFAHLRSANEVKLTALKRAGRAFDPAEHAAFIDALIATFDRSFFERGQTSGLETEVPVFIVGMPRSGTTLVEQILSSHGLVSGAGELGTLESLLGPRGTTAEAYPRRFPNADRDELRATARSYLERLQRDAPSAVRVLDKMPDNYVHIGAIAALFPDARIIHCQRESRDTCLSCYFQNFSGITYTCTLEHLGFSYVQYLRLMAHWRSVSPLRTFEVRYEDLVANQERVTRDLVAFCGLPWDDQCLAFQKNPRLVQTASRLQVREPVYTRSVARWKAYAKHLEALEAALSG
jgi:hypothetical protein